MLNCSLPPMRACALLLLIGCALSSSALAADELAVLPETIGDRAPSAMMPHYISMKVHEALARRKAKYEELKTPEDIFARARKMREFFVEQLGGFPERTPLNARVVDRIERDGYRIEKILFESQPRLFVTALLFLPVETEPPYPGVLVPCGHTGNGKAGYQHIAILLARNGMAALCYDPIEQGERCQLLNDKGKPLAAGTGAHNRIGVGSILLGRNTATFRVWDGMRAIDYLAGREEVDPKRIGCTGNSGGGTLTSYLMALDDRIQCAAPSCYLTSFERLFETIGPQDAEQHIHGQLAFGMGQADYVHMRAPRPTLMCTATHDFFDIQGSWDTFREAKRLYTRLGFAERVDLIETDNGHGFHSPLRVGAVRWMRRWLMGIDDAVTEPETAVLTDDQARCTPKGQVVLLDGAKTTYDLNNEYEAELAGKRRDFWARTDRAEAIGAVRRATGIRALGDLPKPEVDRVGRVDREGYTIEKLIFRPEDRIWLPALLFVPKEPKAEACLYLDERGKQAAAAPGGEIEKLVQEGHVVLAVDPRGIGETSHAPVRRSDYAKYLGPEWAESTLAYMLDTSYLKMRAEDMLICARFLANYEATEQPRPVRIVATGVLGPPALHAAALEPEQIAGLTLRGSVQSWADVVREPWAMFQYVNVVHGALEVYDLPDLVASLPEGSVEIVDPRRPDGRPVNKPDP
ncbi:MAG: acetylxylan esterase [Pirellulales bacterium]|nr:acetylxylan esterase [Pirellulales bacterium]